MKTFKDTPDIQRFSDGETIVSEGIISNNAYIILKGQVSVSKKIEKRIIVIGTLKEGEVFGEMGLISSSVRSTNVSAIGEVTIGVINKTTFQEQLNTLPNDARRILEALVDRLRHTTDQMSRLGVELEKTRNVIQSFSLKHLQK
ncbi:MAG: Crp/Fnr family transcriptional regulator [Nitrospinales bacterium]